MEKTECIETELHTDTLQLLTQKFQKKRKFALKSDFTILYNLLEKENSTQFWSTQKLFKTVNSDIKAHFQAKYKKYFLNTNIKSMFEFLDLNSYFSAFTNLEDFEVKEIISCLNEISTSA